MYGRKVTPIFFLLQGFARFFFVTAGLEALSHYTSSVSTTLQCAMAPRSTKTCQMA